MMDRKNYATPGKEGTKGEELKKSRRTRRHNAEGKGEKFNFPTPLPALPSGSDGLPTEKSYASYLEASEEFKAKAKKYAKDNLHLKNSTLQYTKHGYESSEQLEEEVLSQREQHLMEYRKLFNTAFNDDINSWAECFTGKSKKVRVIRELDQKRSTEFSDDFDKKWSCWFTRYCILSRFIQAVRKIILLKRMEKALAILKTIKPEVDVKADFQ